MTCFGEEACVIGTAAGLEKEDMLYTQYREQGAHYWRGFTIDQMISQCIGNSADEGKGRQMPIHYGSKTFNNMTVSSPLCTNQLTQAPKPRRPQALATYTAPPTRIRWRPVLSERGQPARVISPVL